MNSLFFLSLIAACGDAPDPSSPPADDDADSSASIDDTEGIGPDDTAPGSPYGLASRPDNATCLAPDRPASDAEITLTPIYPALRFSEPVQMLQAPGDESRWFVLELYAGRIQVFDDDPTVADHSTWLDLSDRVYAADLELGLLSAVFHPGWPAVPYLYVSYTGRESGRTVSRLSRFTSADGGQTVDASGEEILLSIEQPHDNHNGSHLLFGPDGYLYASFGDGGSSGDPQGHGQDPTTLLGTILRLDVDGGAPYAIPDDNPFAAGGERPGQGAEEIYAWGLRNVWRFSFDPETGDLWAGDVGQNAFEEVDLIEKGGNYGWNIMEGNSCYNAATCDQGGLIPPVVDYPHPAGLVSVVGGEVYRGAAIPALVGDYLFADYYNGNIYRVIYDDEGAADWEVLLNVPGAYLGSFTRGHDGELYLVDTSQGRLYRLDPAGEPVESDFPELLSTSGCFEAADPEEPVDALIPYDVNVPFWSDGAEKRRWFAIPDGETIDVSEDSWSLPIGSVVAKSFYLDGAPIETRLLIRHEDGGWAGYSYEWDGDDASLLPGSKKKSIGDQEWYYPSRAECMQCHTAEAGYTLGLSTRQLNGEATYEAGSAHQLETLSHIEVLSSPLDASADRLPPLEELDTEGQARAWLHSNCSPCHLADGDGPGDLDYATPLDETELCGTPAGHGDLGIDGAQPIYPGDAARSTVYQRVLRLDADRMPPLGSLVVDEAGAEILEAWIDGLESCE